MKLVRHLPAFVLLLALALIGGGRLAAQSGDAPRPLTAGKTPATVILGNLYQVADGAPESATATTIPAGLAVNFTYNGSSTAPTAAGTYTVVGTINDPNFQGSATGTLTIFQTAAEFTTPGLIYVVNSADGQNGDGYVGVYASNGTPVNSQLITGLNGPVGLVVSGSDIFVANVNNFTVAEYTTAGATVNASLITFPTSAYPVSLAGSGSDLFIELYVGYIQVDEYTTAGAAVNTYSVGSKPVALAVSASELYVLGATYAGPNNNINDDLFGFSTTSSSQGQLLHVAAPGASGLALAAGNVLVGDPSNNSIDLFNATSGSFDGSISIPGLSGTTPQLTVAGQDILISTSNSIAVYTTTGSLVNPAFITGLNNPTGIVVVPGISTVTLGNLSQTYAGTPEGITATTAPSGLAVGITYNGSTTAPTTAGTYAVVATVNDPFYQGTTSGSLTIAPATAGLSLAGLNQTYDSLTESASATTTPAGLAVTYTYNGSTTVPTAAGTYTVVATINDPNYQGTATSTFTIAQRNQAITFGALPNVNFGGTPISLTATASSGLPVSYGIVSGPATVSGNILTLTGTGSVTVAAIQAGDSNNNPATSVQQSFAVAVGTASVTLGSLNQTYNGTPESATATTSPAGLTVGLTYNGSATAPTTAGTYTVAATVSASNYQGSATGTLTIAKAAATVTLGSLSQTYAGTTESVTVTTSPAGLNVGLTYNGSTTAPTTGGTYTVAATVNDPNYQGTATGTFTIAKAAATVALGNLSQTYAGVAEVATATTSPAGLGVSFTYNGSTNAPTNAGAYTVAATINDPSYQGSATGSLTIAPAAATVTLSNLSQTYTGSAKSATVTTSPTGLGVGFTYNGSSTAPINAGTYTVAATITNPNYLGSATGSFTIAQGTATVTLGSLTQTYTGSAKSATATTSPTGLGVGFTYNGSATAPTNAGTYTVAATVNNANYQGSATGSLTIAQAAATVTLSNLSQTYSGTALPITAATNPGGLTVNFTYNGSAMAPTNAGTYTVAGTISNQNYAGSANGTLVVNQAAAGVALGNLSATYNGASQTATAITNPPGLAVGFTYNGSGTNPTGAGSYTVVATVEDPNYAGNATGTLNVGKAPATLALADLSQAYNGAAKTVSAITTPSGLAVGFTYNGNVTNPTAAGSYAVVGTIFDPNYTGSASATLTILPDYASYQSQYFTPSQLLTPTLSGPTANPAMDGMANLLKYAFDLDPTQADAVNGYPVVGQANGVLTLIYIQRTDITDLTYTVQVSSDLQTWNSGPTYTQQLSSTPLDATRNLVVVGALAPLNAAPAQFIRLSVTQP